MPQALTVATITIFMNHINTNGLSGAKEIYAALDDLGYKYASWALGVANGETLTGQSALDYLQGTALIGVGGNASNYLTQQEIDKIRLDMAKAYLSTLLDIAQDSGGQVERDVSFSETRAFHDQVFISNDLSLNNWTLEIPMALIKQQYGEGAVELIWSALRDTGGTYLSGNTLSAALMSYVSIQQNSSDPLRAEMADLWIQNIVGDNIFAAIQRYSGFLSIAVGFSIDNVFSDFDHILYRIANNINDTWQQVFGFRLGDPLAIDLDGDGIETINIGFESIFFDHNNDGIKTSTGWLSGDDAWLVLDKNGNGIIDSGRELFGVDTEVTFYGQTYLANSGYEAILSLDLNHDGIIDAQDSAFTSLQLWRDLNQDGISQSNELSSITSHGIVSLPTHPSGYSDWDINGNKIVGLSSVQLQNGDTLAIGNMELVSLPFHRKFSTLVPTTDAANSLPEIMGSGWVRDLREAMSLSTPEGEALLNLVNNFVSLERSEQRGDLDELIDAWARTNEIYPSLPPSKKFFVIGHDESDPIHDHITSIIYALEVFNGETIEQRGFQLLPMTNSSGDQVYRFSIHSPQADLLVSTYDSLRESIYESIAMQSRLKAYVDKIQVSFTSQDVQLDGTQLLALLEANHQLDLALASYNTAFDLVDLVKYSPYILKSSGIDALSMIREWTHDADAATRQELQQAGVIFADQTSGSDYRDIFIGDDSANWFNAGGNRDQVSAGAGDDTIEGNAGDDIIYGDNGDDQLWGDDGNDVIHGGTGTDYVDGGDGNDTLSGGAGNDVLDGRNGNNLYLFNLGDGQDFINVSLDANSDKLNILRFGAGVSAENLTFGRPDDAWNGKTLEISIVDTSDKIIVDFFYWLEDPYQKYNPIQRIEFIDGSYLSLDDILSKPITGTSASETIYGTVQHNVVLAGDGDDVIFGNAGDDSLQGGHGHDTLNGGEGNDLLIGGAGDDYLDGQAGNNVYFFSRGDGQDVVVRNWVGLGSDHNVLSFGDQINPHDITVERPWTWDGSPDLHVAIAGSLDHVVIEGFFNLNDPNTPINPIQAFTFADETTWSLEDILNRYFTGTSDSEERYGTALADAISLGSGNDHAWGEAGNDSIRGGEGNDFVMGMSGDDTYLFARGDGQDIIDNSYGDINDFDTISFDPGITADQLWFRQVGQNLEVSVIGTEDKLIISEWFQGYETRIDIFKTQEATLASANVAGLVNAMAGYDMPSYGSTSLPDELGEILTPMITSSWNIWGW